MVLRDKNILVTGGTGFIGSHLVKRLCGEKANVIVPYQSINPKSYFFDEKLNGETTLVHVDTKNYRRLFDVVSKYEIDLIFHLAAQSIVPTSFYNPLETLETNILGTANILEAARNYGRVSGIIVVSSDKAYGKIPRASEKDSLWGNHPYETSKAAGDLVATTYFATYGLPVVVTRFGNVYGEGDLNFSRIIPGVLKAIIEGEELEIRSNGKYVRDYIYVGDIVDCLILLVKKIGKLKGEAFNISSSENLSVLEVLKRAEEVTFKKVRFKIMNSAVNEIPIQSLNCAKIKNTLGWSAKHDLRKALPAIFDWYTNYFEKK